MNIDDYLAKLDALVQQADKISGAADRVDNLDQLPAAPAPTERSEMPPPHLHVIDGEANAPQTPTPRSRGRELGTLTTEEAIDRLNGMSGDIDATPDYALRVLLHSVDPLVADAYWEAIGRWEAAQYDGGWSA